MWNISLLILLAVVVSDATRVTEDNPQEKEYGWISKEKCKQYSKWEEEPQKNRYIENCNTKSTIQNKITRGQLSSVSEFPHMAKLIYYQPSQICGASLISDQYLLTAAHCLKDAIKPPHAALLGAGTKRTRITIEIEETFSHPLYKRPQKNHDIAVVKLKSPIPKFTQFIRPACLQTENFIQQKKAIITGWGTINPRDDSKISTQLLKATIPLYDHPQCVKTYKKHRLPVNETIMICAGEGYMNSCQGDSGGPLQVKKKCIYTIIGVISTGKDDCAGIGIYTRVSHYIPWIESIVWPNNI